MARGLNMRRSLIAVDQKTVFAPEVQQDYGANPIGVRETDKYVSEYVRGFVDKWDELIDWEQRAESEGRFFIDTLKARGKYKNLVRDNRVSLCFLDPDNPIRYIEIRGHASLADDPQRITINKMAQHHMGVDEYPYDEPGAERATVTVEVEEVWIQP